MRIYKNTLEGFLDIMDSYFVLYLAKQEKDRDEATYMLFDTIEVWKFFGVFAPRAEYKLFDKLDKFRKHLNDTNLDLDSIRGNFRKFLRSLLTPMAKAIIEGEVENRLLPLENVDMGEAIDRLIAKMRIAFTNYICNVEQADKGTCFLREIENAYTAGYVLDIFESESGYIDLRQCAENLCVINQHGYGSRTAIKDFEKISKQKISISIRLPLAQATDDIEEDEL